VRIIPSHEKWPTEADPFFCRSDIRKRLQKQFSRPMTGHTPRKLPRFRAISRIIAVRILEVSGKIRKFPLHALDYDTTLFFICQEEFQKKSQIRSAFFVDYGEIFCSLSIDNCRQRR